MRVGRHPPRGAMAPPAPERAAGMPRRSSCSSRAQPRPTCTDWIRLTFASWSVWRGAPG